MLCEICQIDRGYLSVIRESSVVKNVVKLLRRTGTSALENDREKREEREEEKAEKMVDREITVIEKIGLLELLLVLVKGDVEISDEEELIEVVLELEEEGNKHAEEEEEEGKGEGEGEGGKEEEKREWEDLSERAHELVWVMERLKKRREEKEGKRKERIEWTEMKNEEEIDEENTEMKKECVEMERENCMLDGENRKVKEEVAGMKEENKHMKTFCPLITSLDNTSVTFPEQTGMKREGNLIIHTGNTAILNCFIGGVLTSV